MRYRTKTTGLILLSGLLGLTGCFKLSRGEPAQQHYVLGGGLVRGETAALASPAIGFTIGVRRLQLASYLESPFIIIRRGSHEIGFSEFHRWGEPVGGGINRTVAGYLAARPAVRGVGVAPWPARERYDYILQIHVSRFEGVAPDDPTSSSGEAHLLANWEILRQQDGTVLARGTTDHRQPGWRVGDHAGLVTLLDAGLKVVADDIMTRIEGLAGR